MATKREEFMAQYRSDGLKAQQADRERQTRLEEEMNRRAEEVNRQHREILHREFELMKEHVRNGNYSGLSTNDIAYFRSFCEKPHEDGSECSPTWDGYVYLCFTALREETTKATRMEYEQMMEAGLQRVMRAAREHPLVPGDLSAK